LPDPTGAAVLDYEEDEKELVFQKLPPAFAVYVAPLELLPYPA